MYIRDSTLPFTVLPIRFFHPHFVMYMTCTSPSGTGEQNPLARLQSTSNSKFIPNDSRTQNSVFLHSKCFIKMSYLTQGISGGMGRNGKTIFRMFAAKCLW